MFLNIMFCFLVGSLIAGAVSSVRSSYRAIRETNEGWLLLSDAKIDLTCSEESKKSLEVYQDFSPDTAKEGCQKALPSLAV
jgi:hypothetical protein